MNKQEYQKRLGLILLTHGNRLLDFKDAKEDLYFGELLDIPLQAICLLNEEAIGADEATALNNGLVGLTHKDETRNQLRQELKQIIGTDNV